MDKPENKIDEYIRNFTDAELDGILRFVGEMRDEAWKELQNLKNILKKSKQTWEKIKSQQYYWYMLAEKYSAVSAEIERRRKCRTEEAG